MELHFTRTNTDVDPMIDALLEKVGVHHPPIVREMILELRPLPPAELGAYDLPTLHEDQILWADEQGRSLQEFFDSQGRDEKVQIVRRIAQLRPDYISS